MTVFNPQVPATGRRSNSMRRLVLALVLLMFGTVLPLTVAPAAALQTASQDPLRVEAVANLVDAYEAMHAQTGTYVTPAGSRGGGQGFFDLNGGVYTSVEEWMIDEGYLYSWNLFRDPDYVENNTGRMFLVYRCKDRVAVFAKTDTAEASAGDAAWWDANCSTVWPQLYDYTYFELSTSTKDALRVEAVANVVDAYQAMHAQTGTYVTPAGSRGGGQGFFDLNGGVYTSVEEWMIDEGYLYSWNLFRDPDYVENNTGRMFLVYRCKDRVAVFAKTDSTEASAGDAAWWDANCPDVWPQLYDYTYFELSTSTVDALRVEAVAGVVDAYETMHTQTGTYVTPAGSRGGGQGFFDLNGGAYTSVEEWMISQGHLNAANLFRDPGYVENNTGQMFLVYRCKDRVAVFAKTDSTEASAGDAAWWETNCSTVWPLMYGYTYFELATPPVATAPLTGMVTDAATGDPLEDVAVCLDGHSTCVFTDSNGGYEFLVDTGQSYTVRFTGTNTALGQCYQSCEPVYVPPVAEGRNFVDVQLSPDTEGPVWGDGARIFLVETRTGIELSPGDPIPTRQSSISWTQPTDAGKHPYYAYYYVWVAKVSSSGELIDHSFSAPDNTGPFMLSGDAFSAPFETNTTYVVQVQASDAAGNWGSMLTGQFTTSGVYGPTETVPITSPWLVPNPQPSHPPSEQPNSTGFTPAGTNSPSGFVPVSQRDVGEPDGSSFIEAPALGGNPGSWDCDAIAFEYDPGVWTVELSWAGIPTDLGAARYRAVAYAKIWDNNEFNYRAEPIAEQTAPTQDTSLRITGLKASTNYVIRFLAETEAGAIAACDIDDVQLNRSATPSTEIACSGPAGQLQILTCAGPNANGADASNVSAAGIERRLRQLEADLDSLKKGIAADLYVRCGVTIVGCDRAECNALLLEAIDSGDILRVYAEAVALDCETTAAVMQGLRQVFLQAVATATEYLWQAVLLSPAGGPISCAAVAADALGVAVEEWVPDASGIYQDCILLGISRYLTAAQKAGLTLVQAIEATDAIPRIGAGGSSSWRSAVDCSLIIEPDDLPRGSSTRLGTNLQATGEVRPTDEGGTGHGYSAHHIVEAGHPDVEWVTARYKLAECGIDIDESINGVFLPETCNFYNPDPRTVHNKLHTHKYRDEVTEDVINAQTRVEVLEVLASVKAELLAGTERYYSSPC